MDGNALPLIERETEFGLQKLPPDTSDGLNAVRENEVPVTEAIVEREGERSEVERERREKMTEGTKRVCAGNE
jgi:uncharacterized protein GlcG (DUF336 family)